MRILGHSWRETLVSDQEFWLAVKKRAEKLYEKDTGREAPKWFATE